MAGASKITHKGKKILYIDYQGCRTDEQMIEVLHAAVEIVKTDNKEYLQLTDLNNAFISPGYMKEAKQVAKTTPKLAKKRAVVGISSKARLILLKAYNLVLGTSQQVKPFNTIEEAKDWLVS
jgi:hypothetical protein